MKSGLIAWIGSILLGVTGISVFFRKNIVKITKAIKVSRDVLDIIDDSVQSSQDGKLTPEEIQKIIDLVNKLKEDLK